MVEKSLTRPGRRRKVLYMEDALAALVSQGLGSLSIRGAAAVCELPDYLLRDIVYKRTKRPAPETLRALEKGLGIPYPNLALAAYGIITPADLDLEVSADTPPLEDGAPPDSNAAWRNVSPSGALIS